MLDLVPLACARPEVTHGDVQAQIAIDDIATFHDVAGSAGKTSRSAAPQWRSPSIDDLILTKQFASRPMDLEDIRLLREERP